MCSVGSRLVMRKVFFLSMLMNGRSCSQLRGSTVAPTPSGLDKPVLSHIHMHKCIAHVTVYLMEMACSCDFCDGFGCQNSPSKTCISWYSRSWHYIESMSQLWGINLQGIIFQEQNGHPVKHFLFKLICGKLVLRTMTPTKLVLEFKWLTMK